MKVGEVKDLEALASGLADGGVGRLGLCKPACQVEGRNGRERAKTQKVLAEHLRIIVSIGTLHMVEKNGTCPSRPPTSALATTCVTTDPSPRRLNWVKQSLLKLKWLQIAVARAGPC